ncbi:MAG: hypothetical protein PHV49_06415, partial [Alistipes sp.]|nr:hypothetical protein [Alistipes sp.]
RNKRRLLQKAVNGSFTDFKRKGFDRTVWIPIRKIPLTRSSPNGVGEVGWGLSKEDKAFAKSR